MPEIQVPAPLAMLDLNPELVSRAVEDPLGALALDFILGEFGDAGVKSP